MRLENRVVFITGASRGIGRACALRGAAEGARVIVAARTHVAGNARAPGTIRCSPGHEPRHFSFAALSKTTSTRGGV